MSQPPVRRCSNCGTEANIDQRFCSGCGAPLDREENTFTAISGHNNPTPTTVPPPPPDVDQYETLRQQSGYTPPTPGGESYHSLPTENSFVPPSPYANPTPYANAAQPQMNYAAPVFTGATTPRDTKKILGGIGCGALLLILIPVLLCGGLGLALFVLPNNKTATDTATVSTNEGSTGSNSKATPASQAASTDSNNKATPASQAGNTGGNSYATPASSTANSIPLNLAVKYSTIDYTIVDVKQASSFPGDNSSSATNIVRVDLKETNSTNRGVNIGYSDVVRLVLPDQSGLPPTSYKNISPPANGASQDNWLDFSVPTTVALNKLILRFGTPQEAQIDVPLTTGANLTKYQDVTVKPGTVTTYTGLKWTLTSATSSWSGAGKQAENGKRYVTINVSIDNSTTTDKNGYWGDYLRLKAGDLTSSADTDSTIPLSFAAYSTGSTGSASFLVPQGTTTFTIILLADKFGSGVPQSTIEFHIP